MNWYKTTITLEDSLDSFIYILNYRTSSPIEYKKSKDAMEKYAIIIFKFEYNKHNIYIKKIFKQYDKYEFKNNIFNNSNNISFQVPVNGKNIIIDSKELT